MALGCHQASSVDHLHAESVAVLPIEAHLRLFSAQFLAQALQPHHPSHRHVTLDRGPRAMKETLQSKLLDVVRPYLNEHGVIDPGSYNDTLRSIHCDIVSQTVDGFVSNRVLNAPPPPLDPNDRFLPRLTRATLCQLRSGHCARLQDFLHRIGRADDDLCPECRGATHSTSHLFSCPSFPTSLDVSDLWSKTWCVAVFLQTLPSFSFLPSPGPPPPPPYRRRRGRPPPAPPPPWGAQLMN